MITLLPAITASLSGLIVARQEIEVAIVPADKWLPATARMPFVGVLPGGTAYEELTCAVNELSAVVVLVALVRMDDTAEAALCGSLGAFALLDAATSLLLAGWSSLAGCQGAEVIKDHPSELMTSENNQLIVQATRSLLYTVQR